MEYGAEVRAQAPKNRMNTRDQKMVGENAGTLCLLPAMPIKGPQEKIPRPHHRLYPSLLSKNLPHQSSPHLTQQMLFCSTAQESFLESPHCIFVKKPGSRNNCVCVQRDGYIRPHFWNCRHGDIIIDAVLWGLTRQDVFSCHLFSLVPVQVFNTCTSLSLGPTVCLTALERQ